MKIIGGMLILCRAFFQITAHLYHLRDVVHLKINLLRELVPFEILFLAIYIVSHFELNFLDYVTIAFF